MPNLVSMKKPKKSKKELKEDCCVPCGEQEQYP